MEKRRMDNLDRVPGSNRWRSSGEDVLLKAIVLLVDRHDRRVIDDTAPDERSQPFRHLGNPAGESKRPCRFISLRRPTRRQLTRVSDWSCVIEIDAGELTLPRLREIEINGDYTGRLAILEELKTLPFGAIWDYYCTKQDVPSGPDWLTEVKDYETKITNLR